VGQSFNDYGVRFFFFLFLRRDIVNRQYADDRFLFSNENPGFI
jgi:hypothetical protein